MTRIKVMVLRVLRVLGPLLPPPMMGGIIPADAPHKFKMKTDNLVREVEAVERELRGQGIVNGNR